METVGSVTRAPFAVREGLVDKCPPRELWVGHDDKVSSVASSIVVFARARKIPYLDVAAIGPLSVNQAVKAIALARERLGSYQLDLLMQPYFSSVEDANSLNRTRMVFRLSCISNPA